MNRLQIGTVILFAGIWAAQSAVAEELAADQPTNVAGIETVCTGTSLEARSDPRWNTYPLRLEFSSASGHYLGDETVTITGNGKSVDVSCAGPWILMKLPEGNYKVDAEVADAGRKTITAHVPASGQARVVVSFPDVSVAKLN